MTDFTYNGKNVARATELIFNMGKLPPAEIKKVTAMFNPTKFNAEDWVRAVKAGGAKYLVVTAKRHDGLAMFDSKVGDFCITKSTPFKRDPIKELSEACKKHGLKFGVWYSHTQDFVQPGGLDRKDRWDKAQDGSRDDFTKNIAVPQLHELLSNYGDIDLLWWDKASDISRERSDAFNSALKNQPKIIQNNRRGAGRRTDFEVLEGMMPSIPFSLPAWDWESVDSICDGNWVYNKTAKWRPAQFMVRNVIEAASRGGNYSISVPAMGEGRFPDQAIETLRDAGKWFDQFGDSVYATTESPFLGLPVPPCTVRVGATTSMLYFHLFDWPADGIVPMPGLKNEIESAWLLGDQKKRKLFIERSDMDAFVHLTGGPIHPIASVLAVRVKGMPAVIRPPIVQRADGSFDLSLNDALAHGKEFRCLPGRTPINISFWNKSSEWIEWELIVKRPGQYAAAWETSSVNDSAFEIVVGTTKAKVKAPSTGDYNKWEPLGLDSIELPAGKVSVAVKPVASEWKGTNFRNFVIKPK